jgi:hypothetical protein
LRTLAPELVLARYLHPFLRSLQTLCLEPVLVQELNPGRP